jgi:uncharacterized membrane protein YeaQ/YmgE (transglycosylase-associated protein family)
MYLIGFLLIGVVVGFLAGYAMTGQGYGVFWDMVVGAVGAVVAGLVLSLVFGAYTTGLVISFLGAALAAVVLVGVLHVVYKRGRPRVTPP